MAIWPGGLASLLVFVLTGCTGQVTPGATTSAGFPTPLATTSAGLVTPNVATPSFAALPRPAELARRDLAEQLRVPLTNIETVSIEQAVWPNKCLGVAAPELCAPGAVSGYAVVFRVSGKEYFYHTDANESFRYAGPGDAPGPN